MKLSNAIESYQKYHSFNSKKNTLKNYEFLFTRSSDEFSDRELESITPDEILSFLTRLTEGTLIALSISATVNPAAQLAMEKLEELHGCEVHMTHIPTPGDEAGLRRLGVNITSDPNFSTKDLFIS